MKIADYIKFKKFLKTSNLSLSQDGLKQAFKEYSNYEIKKLGDLFREHDGFVDIVFREKRSFVNVKEINNYSLLSSLYGLVCDFNDYSDLEDFYADREGNFVKKIENIAGRDASMRILDVGAGRVPFSSAVLSQNYKVKVQDPLLILSENCLKKNFNIDSQDTEFNENTSIDNVDFVVGCRPCGAIEHIARKCASEGKPYFMELCSCKSPDGTMNGFMEYLKARCDKNIRFERQNDYPDIEDDTIYAFNLEPDQLSFVM